MSQYLYKKGKKWWFWNETWTELIGPYDTKRETIIKFKEYCEQLG